MTKPEIDLLSYDQREVELGLKPWSSFSSFLDGEGIHQKGRIENALTRLHRSAQSDFRGAPSTEYPFLFRRTTLEPYESFSPPLENEGVLIALDALYDIAEVALRTGRDFYAPGVGPFTRNAIIKYINREVESATSSVNP